MAEKKDWAPSSVKNRLCGYVSVDIGWQTGAGRSIWFFRSLSWVQPSLCHTCDNRKPPPLTTFAINTLLYLIQLDNPILRAFQGTVGDYCTHYRALPRVRCPLRINLDAHPYIRHSNLKRALYFHRGSTVTSCAATYIALSCREQPCVSPCPPQVRRAEQCMLAPSRVSKLPSRDARVAFPCSLRRSWVNL